MNTEIKPSLSAIFNSSEFQVSTGSSSSKNYLIYPVGQGTESFPFGINTTSLIANTVTSTTTTIPTLTTLSSIFGGTLNTNMIMSDASCNLIGNMTMTNSPTFVSIPQVNALWDSAQNIGIGGKVLNSTATGTLWGNLSYTSNMIGSPVLYTSPTITPIVFPAGAVTATIMLISGGGNGASGLITGNSITNGGIGSAGNVMIFSRIPCANGVFTCRVNGYAQLYFVNSPTNKPDNMDGIYPLIASCLQGNSGSPAGTSTNGASGASSSTTVNIATFAPTYTCIGGSGSSLSVASTPPYYTQVPSRNASAGAYQSYCQGGYYTNQIITTPVSGYNIGTQVPAGTGVIVVISYAD